MAVWAARRQDAGHRHSTWSGLGNFPARESTECFFLQESRGISKEKFVNLLEFAEEELGGEGEIFKF